MRARVDAEMPDTSAFLAKAAADFAPDVESTAAAIERMSTELEGLARARQLLDRRLRGLGLGRADRRRFTTQVFGDLERALRRLRRVVG